MSLDSPFHDAFEAVGDVRYYHNLVQGSDEWARMRLGMLTASEIDRVLTPTLKVANNDKSRLHFYDLLAQRITNHVDDHFVSYDMERGKLEEGDARNVYDRTVAPVRECGFVVNESLGFPVGCSPDGLVGDDGMIEIKSRMAKHQMKTIVEHVIVADGPPIPPEFMLQVQGSLFVTERKWCDFISHSNGFNQVVIRVLPIMEYQDAIEEAATKLEDDLRQLQAAYRDAIASGSGRITAVERIDYSNEIMLGRNPE